MIIRIIYLHLFKQLFVLSIDTSFRLFSLMKLMPLSSMLHYSRIRCSLFFYCSKHVSQLQFIRSSTSLLVQKSNLNCIICLSEVTFPCSVLPCGHMFCTPCLEAMIDTFQKQYTSLSCPLCHRFFSVNEVIVCFSCETGYHWRCLSSEFKE